MMLYIGIFVLLCFVIPILFTRKFENKEVSQIEINEENGNIKQKEEGPYDYKEYNKIKVIHTKTNQIEEIALDEYLYGVVCAEMPANFEQEALKAQAIVARTYTLFKIKNSGGKHAGADICDDSTCCQAWISKEDRFARWEEAQRESNWEKIIKAVNSSKGKVITYNGALINAFFHSNSGGKTETTANVWGGTGYPYLQSVETAGEDSYTQYASEAKCSKEDLIKKMKEKHSNFEIDFTQEDCIKVLEYTDGDRVKTIKIGNVEISGVEVRSVFSLRSANFKVTIEGEVVKFEVVGYGHGVGMSQTGADSMAKEGKLAEEIVKHFYTGVEVINF